MPLTITFTDITVDKEYRIYQDTVTGDVFGTIGGTFTNAEGFKLHKSATVGPLTGTALTRAAALFNDLKALYKTQEGI